jgi:hypothetical protein
MSTALGSFALAALLVWLPPLLFLLPAHCASTWCVVGFFVVFD